jgi:predicted nucleic acid-binding protein
VRVFLDTNILIDIVEQRAQFFAASQQVLERCELLGCAISIAPHGLATVIQQILAWAEVATTGDAESRRATSYGILDYEDALQAAAAEACAADWLVTRDSGGFAGSPVPILSPDEFLQRFPPSPPE